MIFTDVILQAGSAVGDGDNTDGVRVSQPYRKTRSANSEHLRMSLPSVQESRLLTFSSFFSFFGDASSWLSLMQKLNCRYEFR